MKFCLNLTGGGSPSIIVGMNRATNPYAGYRYPAEIISHAVWLYFRFTLSFRDIEELLAARGILVTYNTKCY